MKSRMNIMLVGVLVMLGAILLTLVRGQKMAMLSAATPTGASVPPALQIQPQTLPPPPLQSPSVQLPTAPAPALVEPAQPALTAAPPAMDDSASPAAPLSDKSDAGEKIGYTAVKGDTLSNLAIGLLGSDSKKNRDAVIAANSTLQADPDRILVGKMYTFTVPATDSVAAPSQLPAVNIPATQPVTVDTHSDSDRVLKYTAKPGDSVSALAAGLLGSDSKTNRDAIIDHNQSLQNDPNLVVTGKTYKIPTSSGLSSAPTPTVVLSPLPSTQPDADDLVQQGEGRQLRYTALVGDSVSKLAVVLLGSDTQANRDAIINTNVSLKNDPDRVVAGQTYWIPAPAAPVGQP